MQTTITARRFTRNNPTLFKVFQMGAYGNDVYDYPVHAPVVLVQVVNTHPGNVTLFPAPTRAVEPIEF